MAKRYGFYHGGMLLRPLMREEAEVIEEPMGADGGPLRYRALIQIMKSMAFLIGAQGSEDIEILEMVRDTN